MQYQQSFLACPHCHRDHLVQKVSAIVANGTATGMARGILVGQVRGRHFRRRRFTGASVGWNRQQTQLAALLSPPQPPHHRAGWVTTLGSLVFALPLLFAGPPAASATFASSPSHDIAIEDLLLLACASAIALLCALYVRGRPKRQQAMAAWLDAMARWQSALYCHRCDVVFIPGVRGSVSPQAMQALLH